MSYSSRAIDEIEVNAYGHEVLVISVNKVIKTTCLTCKSHGWDHCSQDPGYGTIEERPKPKLRNDLPTSLDEDMFRFFGFW